MNKFAIAIASLVVGAAVGYGACSLQQRASSDQLSAWRAEMDAVQRWFEEIPGFIEHQGVLLPLLNVVQYQASESIERPPDSERTRQAYRAVVVLFLAQDHFEGLDAGPANVVQRALQRVGFNSYWTDPGLNAPSVPAKTGQHDSGGS